MVRNSISKWLVKAGVLFGICLALLLTVGCPAPSKPEFEEDEVSEQAVAPPPLSLLLVDTPGIAPLIERQWSARRDGQLTSVEISSDELRSGDYRAIEESDVVIYPVEMIGELIKRGLIQKVPRSVWDADEFNKKELFRKSRTRLVQFGSDPWGTPLGSPQLVLMFRRDVLEQLGEKPPKTWDDFFALNKKLQEAKPQDADGNPLPVAVDIPMFLAFAIAGAAVMWLLTRPDIGETGRIIAVGLLVVAVFHFLAGMQGWYPMLQKARLSFVLLAVFALIAHNFAGDAAQRRRFTIGWVVTLGVMHYMITMINTPSTVVTPTDDFLGGFSMTLFVAVMTMLLSFPLGVLLALARTSRLPIFRVMATTYIEVVRGIPLITVLFFFSVMVNLFLPRGMELAEIAAVVTGFVLFSAAYLAENVRGGLQSVMRGQYEAADALGLTTAQRTGFIVLPQALRVSIPPLVGQMINISVSELQ